MLIDTHQAVRRLQQVGVSEEQAEAFVEVVNSTDSEVPTKADLEKAKRQIIVTTVSLKTALMGLLLALFEFAV